MIQLNNLTIGYNNKPIMEGLNYTFENRKIYGILAPSGSGKTTLLRCINFLTELDSGEMLLDSETLLKAPQDKDLSESALREKRLNFGLVFQSFNLFPQYNVLDNVTLAPNMLLLDEVKKYKKSLNLFGIFIFTCYTQLKLKGVNDGKKEN